MVLKILISITAFGSFPVSRNNGEVTRRLYSSAL